MRFIIIFLLPIILFAHSLSVTASYEDGELFIESYFGDGNPCKECFFNLKKDEKELFRAKLADDGVFEDVIDIKPPFDIHINGGLGHWADVKVQGDEMGENSNAISSDTTAINTIDEEKIRQIIRSELNKQNSKIEAMVEKNRSNLERILIGLGYILGIFGLWQLFIRRPKK